VTSNAPGRERSLQALLDDEERRLRDRRAEHEQGPRVEARPAAA
jgi:hypothetical protein